MLSTENYNKKRIIPDSNLDNEIFLELSHLEKEEWFKYLRIKMNSSLLFVFGTILS